MTQKYTPHQLIEINNRFYAEVAGESFAATRQQSWQGWQRLQLPDRQLRVLDVAAGNMRFARFLTEKRHDFAYLGIDASEVLLKAYQVTDDKFQVIDILQHFLDGSDWREKLTAKDFNLVVCNGFLHHVPDNSWREKLLTDMYELLDSGGILTVSFWQFMPELGKLVTEDLGGADYLLTWQGKRDKLRFAHHFSDQEIEQLAVTLEQKGAKRLQDFRADGKTGRMNRYLVWQKL